MGDGMMAPFGGELRSETRDRDSKVSSDFMNKPECESIELSDENYAMKSFYEVV